ncbi:MAG: aspartate aminotransferase family protein [Thermodesulfobacteriota bacterium]
MRIPDNGLSRDEVLRRLESYRVKDLATKGGRTWAYVYDSGRAEVDAVAKQAYMMYLSENALDPTVYPSLLRLETELAAMAAAHLGGDGNTVGNFTSGGTESCMLAVKTARDLARAKRPEIKEPEMILPVTAHAAFHKAAHYFGVKKVITPVDPVTFKADVKAMEKAITPNTILLVASAVSYAHGVVDPIPELGRVALRHDLLLHVDGCIGAFLLPYFRRLGAPVGDFDFSVPGVTSISMDWHKYAYCPKGASIILYRNKAIRKHQFYACAEWTGYTVINSTIQSSKSGGPLAAAWAVLNFIGDDGYMEIARRTYEATIKIIKGLEGIKEIRLLGRPELCLVAFTSDTVSVFHIIDEMKLKNWYIQPQLGYHDSKENIHLSISTVSLDRVDEMLADLEDCVARAKSLPFGQAEAMTRQAFADLDPNQLTDETFKEMLGLAGIQGGELPQRMAEINEMLNALPAKLRERLLIEFLNELFVYRS